MSEYQYYEFQTLDQPLTAEQKAYLHTLSRRAEVTSNSASYNYSYGDFPANPLKVLAEHFDAFLYIANWGSIQLAFRLPQNALKADELKAYLAFDEMTLEAAGEYWILNIDFPSGDDSPDWVEGEGMLDDLAPLRNEILAGDLRALYLVWLQAAENYEASLDGDEMDDEQDDELDEEDDGEEGDNERASGDPELTEPPLPRGLQQLTPALNALIDFIGVDRDIVAAAAQASLPLASKSEPYEEWVAKLPIHERNAFLVRLARGDGRARIDLLTRLREVGDDTNAVRFTQQARRPFAQIKAEASRQHQLRQQKERDAAERKRLATLDKLAKREAEAWQEVAQNLAKRNAGGYDSAVALLEQLHELAIQRNQGKAFTEKLATVVEPYQKSQPLQARLRNSGLR